MALNTTMIFLPIVVLAISIAIGGGGLLGQSSQAIFCNQANPGFATCSNTGNGSVTISCPASAGGGHCFVTSPCPTPAYPAPAYCYAPANAVYLNAGDSVMLSGGQASSGSNGAFFSFTKLDISGFVPWIAIAVGVAVVASLGFLGSGVGTEGVHIMFEAGILLGIWGMFAVLEGFPQGNPNSFFVQLNNMLPTFGTVFYVFLTLMYVGGIVGTISRGASK